MSKIVGVVRRTMVFAGAAALLALWTPSLTAQTFDDVKEKRLTVSAWGNIIRGAPAYATMKDLYNSSGRKVARLSTANHSSPCAPAGYLKHDNILFCFDSESKTDKTWKLIYSSLVRNTARSGEYVIEFTLDYENGRVTNVKRVKRSWSR